MSRYALCTVQCGIINLYFNIFIYLEYTRSGYQMYDPGFFLPMLDVCILFGDSKIIMERSYRILRADQVSWCPLSRAAPI